MKSVVNAMLQMSTYAKPLLPTLSTFSLPPPPIVRTSFVDGPYVNYNSEYDNSEHIFSRKFAKTGCNHLRSTQYWSGAIWTVQFCRFRPDHMELAIKNCLLYISDCHGVQQQT